MSAVPEIDGPIAFSDDGERWIEYGPADARVRVGFHQYDVIYAVPGLYERIFYSELGMRSTQIVVGLLADALGDLQRPIEGERIVDLGAGNGLGGEELRTRGAQRVLGVDLEPVARSAALRDRPGVYEDYLIADLADPPAAEAQSLRRFAPTAVAALSALGPGHAPPAVLDHVLRLLPANGLFAFAVMPTLLPDSTDPDGVASGYPGYLRQLFTDRADRLADEEYVHRMRPDGTEHRAVAFVGRIR